MEKVDVVFRIVGAESGGKGQLVPGPVILIVPFPVPGLQLGQDGLPVVVVLLLEDYHEFVPAYPVHRAVLEQVADVFHRPQEQIVAPGVTVSVIDSFQVVHIHHQHSKGRNLGRILPDQPVQFLDL